MKPEDIDREWDSYSDTAADRYAALDHQVKHIDARLADMSEFAGDLEEAADKYRRLIAYREALVRQMRRTDVMLSDEEWERRIYRAVRQESNEEPGDVCLLLVRERWPYVISDRAYADLVDMARRSGGISGFALADTLLRASRAGQDWDTVVSAD